MSLVVEKQYYNFIRNEFASKGTYHKSIRILSITFFSIWCSYKQ